MKIIFLDIDGVLNYARCKARSPSGCLGIEDQPLKLLKTIVDATGAKIVLTSTWKTDWFITDHIEDLSKDGQYLINRFSSQRLGILDKTYEESWANRGQGILDYLHNSWCESFVIIDDERYDFEERGLTKYFVHTSFNTGLTEEHANRAIAILGGTYDC